MGIFDKLVRGAARGAGNAVGNVAERKANEVVADKANEAADNMIKTSGQGMDAEKMAQAGAISAQNRTAAQAYAAGMMQNMKQCPKCEEATTSDKTFCPKCGARLPNETMGAKYTCKKCKKQNMPGEDFCGGCGAKLK